MWETTERLSYSKFDSEADLENGIDFCEVELF